MWTSSLWALLLATLLAPSQPTWGDDEPLPLDRLATGQWVTVKGAWMPDGKFQAEEVEVTLPASEHQLIGTVEAVYEGAERGLCPRVPVAAISTAEMPRPAERPMHAVLGLERARKLGLSLPHWRRALSDYLDQEGGRSRA